MEDWIDRLADALGERRLGREEIGAMLKLSREVAHGVERRYAPLVAYLAGLHVGAGRRSEDRLARVLDVARSLIAPEDSADEGSAAEERAPEPGA